jgi:hypothetical protein
MIRQIGVGAMAVTTACTSQGVPVPQAGGAITPASSPAVATSPVASPSTTATPPKTPATTRTTTNQAALLLADRTLTAQMSGYDAGLDMLQFRLAHWVSGGADNGHYEGDPADPATHRLALANSPTILSVLGICSDELTADSQGHANKPCTKEQLVQALKNQSFLYAELKVDGADHITKLSELYVP